MVLGIIDTIFLNIPNYLPHLELRNRSILIVVITNFVSIKRVDCIPLWTLLFGLALLCWLTNNHCVECKWRYPGNTTIMKLRLPKPPKEEGTRNKQWQSKRHWHTNKDKLRQRNSRKTVSRKKLSHYENMPIRIYRKFHLQKLKIFR